MSVLEDYFRKKVDTICEHPLLRFVEQARQRDDVDRIAIEIMRPRDVLGFKPAKIYLHLFDEGGRNLAQYQKEDWDDVLNSSLVERGVPAVSVENEKVRFALALRAALQTPETRFGDGFFNAVLVHYIEHGPFARHYLVEPVLKHVHRGGIDPSFRSYAECRDMIDAAIRGRAIELVDQLAYDKPVAEEILAAAVAEYLDERFSVTNRKSMGLL